MHRYLQSDQNLLNRADFMFLKEIKPVNLFLLNLVLDIRFKL
jgi:hypothetical protein